MPTRKKVKAEKPKDTPPNVADTKAKPTSAVEGVRELLGATKKNVPHIEDVTQAIVEKFGGAEKFAAEIYKVASDKSITPATKMRVYENVLRLLQYSSATGASAKLVDDMTDEELQHEIKLYLTPSQAHGN